MVKELEQQRHEHPQQDDLSRGTSKLMILAALCSAGNCAVQGTANFLARSLDSILCPSTNRKPRSMAPRAPST